MKRKILCTVLIIVLFYSIIPIIIPTIGESVIVEDEFVFLEADPATIGSSGWVEFTLISKQFTGDIDVIWGFNSDIAKPMNPQIWKNYTHTLYRWIEVEKIYVNETTLESFNYTSHEKEYYEEDFFDWKPWAVDFTKTQYMFSGMDTWYLIKNLPIEADVKYRVRAWIEIPWAGLEVVDGKYCWGIKRSQDSINEAISTGRFYFIDPWWDSEWTHNIKLTFNNSDSSEDLIDFPAIAFLNSDIINFSECREDGFDIRFIDSDDETILAYEREYWNNTEEEGVFHFKIPKINKSSISDYCYVYWGNPTASDGQNPEAVWDSNYVMVQHMVDETTSTILDSTQYGNDGAKKGANEPIESSGQIDGAQDFDGDDHIDCGDDASLQITDAITLAGWVNLTGSSIQTILGWGTAYDRYWLGFDPLDTPPVIFLYLEDVVNEIVDLPDLDYRNEWHHIAGTYDKDTGNNNMNIYFDSQLQATSTQTGQIGVSAVTLWIGSTHTEYPMTGSIDDVRISNVSRSADWIESQYLSMTDQFITYGFSVKINGVNNPDKIIGVSPKKISKVNGIE